MQTHTPITTQTYAVPDQWLDHYVREAQHLAPIYTGADGRVDAQALAERIIFIYSVSDTFERELHAAIHAIACNVARYTEYRQGWQAGYRDASILRQPIKTGGHTFEAYQEVTARYTEAIYAFSPTPYQLGYGYGFDWRSEEECAL